MRTPDQDIAPAWQRQAGTGAGRYLCLVTQFISDKAVFRTAWATPGLVNICYMSSISNTRKINCVMLRAAEDIKLAYLRSKFDAKCGFKYLF